MEQFRKLKQWFSEKFQHDSLIYRIVDKTYHWLSSIKYDLTHSSSVKNAKQRRHFAKQVKNAIKIINEQYKDSEYIALYNPTWLGVANSTKGLFTNTVPLEQVFGRLKIRAVAKAIIKANIKTIIFSQIVDGWVDVLKKVKKSNPNVKIKVIWHANNFEVMSDYTWDLNKKVLKLYDEKYIDEFAFVKKSMVEFYNRAGYKARYLTNNVHLDESQMKSNKQTDFNRIQVGVYNANSRELKNVYNQLCAVKLIDGAIADIVPTNEQITKFAKMINLEHTSLPDYIDTKDLLNRCIENDINSYITFTECSPMVPLESFEAGVPCLVGSNNDYFQNSKLKSYVVVEREDDPVYIKDKMIECLKNKEEVMELYKQWKEQYDEDCKRYVKEFIED
ncbi:MAG: glycosyltransferase [Clostridia bacterium]|nr:glycosyltransferase [Clostridia bacterium]